MWDVNSGKWALMIFVAICLVNGAGLTLDELLREQGLRTITVIIRERPILGVPILLLQAIGTIALAYHLWICKE